MHTYSFLPLPYRVLSQYVGLQYLDYSSPSLLLRFLPYRVGLRCAGLSKGVPRITAGHGMASKETDGGNSVRCAAGLCFESGFSV